jgi:hypothetical protein
MDKNEMGICDYIEGLFVYDQTPTRHLKPGTERADNTPRMDRVRAKKRSKARQQPKERLQVNLGK